MRALYLNRAKQRRRARTHTPKLRSSCKKQTTDILHAHRMDLSFDSLIICSRSVMAAFSVRYSVDKCA